MNELFNDMHLTQEQAEVLAGLIDDLDLVPVETSTTL